jgi:hypothetical protein
MTVSLGGIVLDDNLVLDGLEDYPARARSTRRTLGGRMVIQVGVALAAGRELTLSGENHFTLAQIHAVKALEESGQAVSLVHHRGTFTVIVTATTVEPAFGYADPVADDWYSGSITMIEV